MEWNVDYLQMMRHPPVVCYFIRKTWYGSIANWKVLRFYRPFFLSYSIQNIRTLVNFSQSSFRSCHAVNCNLSLWIFFSPLFYYSTSTWIKLIVLFLSFYHLSFRWPINNGWKSTNSNEYPQLGRFHLYAIGQRAGHRV